MLRLKRHIVTEIIEVFFAVVIALILIMVSVQLAKLLSQAAAGKIIGTAIYQLVALQVVHLFVLFAPFSFFIAMLITLSRFANEYELVALKSVGFSDWQLLQALLIVAIPLAGVIALMTLSLLPRVLDLNFSLLQKAQKESELSIIQPGQFRTIGGNTTLFVADVEDKQFSRFFVWQQADGVEAITVAKSGQLVEDGNDRTIKLSKGSRYSVSADGSSHRLSFERLTARLPDVNPTKNRDKIKALPTQKLLDNPTLINQIEMQQRISPAISILLLAICAPLLVQLNPRDNRYGKFVAAILIYGLYANSQFISQALIEKGKLPINPGVYSAHLIFAAALITWVVLRYGGKRNSRQPSVITEHA